MKSNFEQVLEFHETFGLPIGESPDPKNLSFERQNLRNGFIIEEFCEKLEAEGYDPKAIAMIEFAWENLLKVYGSSRVKETDLVEVADAVGDLSYFLAGDAVEYGFNLDDVFAEIHASNMSKLDENGNVIYREDGKVLKGPNFFKPNISKVIFGE